MKYQLLHNNGVYTFGTSPAVARRATGYHVFKLQASSFSSEHSKRSNPFSLKFDGRSRQCPCCLCRHRVSISLDDFKHVSSQVQSWASLLTTELITFLQAMILRNEQLPILLDSDQNL
jgi:hypothetical protein